MAAMQSAYASSTPHALLEAQDQSHTLTKSHDHPSTGFLGLPPELRNHIYDLVGCMKIKQCGFCSSTRRGDTIDSTSVTTMTSPKGKVVAVSTHLPCLSHKCCAKDQQGISCFTASTQKSTYLWVNRRSDLARKGAQSPIDETRYAAAVQQIEEAAAARDSTTSQASSDHLFFVVGTKSEEGKTTPEDRCSGQRQCSERACDLKCTAWEHGEKHIVNVSQPLLTRTSKEIRRETLPMFYGTNTSVFCFYDKTLDSPSVIDWLSTIGKHNASLLRKVDIVYRTKKHRLHVVNSLVPEMQRRDVRLYDGVVKVRRLTYPFCYCETCLVRSAGTFSHWKIWKG